MPIARLIDAINAALTPDGVRVLKTEVPAVVELLAEPDSLIAVADKVLGLGPSERDYIAAIPRTLREAMRSGIVDAINDGRGVQVQYSPAYDFELRMWDYGDSLLIHVAGPLSGPYARDSIPTPIEL
jgi:hypothetical protein